MTSPLDPDWTPTADLRAEIERLRLDGEAWKQTAKCFSASDAALRAALKEILNYDPSFSWEIAREALADQGKG